MLTFLQSNNCQQETKKLTDGGAVTEDKARRELEILNKILADLHELEPEGRQRVLQTVSTYYQFSSTTQPRSPVGIADEAQLGPFSEDRSMSVKEFVMQKKPSTAVERVAVLAFYLTHYRDIPHFKTLDISKLNTDAAQPKFTNAAVAVDNATKTGYLVPAPKGNKQLSAAGEVFVQQLPDRDAAKAAMTAARPRRKTRKVSEATEFLLDQSEGGAHKE
jgi:hypothetical protein